ncbi:MAG: hypothetical protein LBL39_03325 [Planctomycetaceae bacterium]|nr:hypothetical protein [Planctomycetaceae bacterium]
MPLFFRSTSKNKGIRARLVALLATKGGVINKGCNDKVCQCGLLVC